MFRRRSFIPVLPACACALIVSICAAPAVAARQRVGVVPTQGADGGAEAAIDDDLRSAVVGMGGLDVVDAAAMAAQLASAKDFGLDCGERDLDCLAKLGVLAGVDLLVWGRVKAPDLELTVVDVKATKEVAHDKGPVPAAGGGARVAVLKGRLTQLMRGPLPGGLDVKTNVAGARIFVADQPQTMPMTGVEPGTYTVAAEADGYQRVQKELVVKGGAVTKETLQLVALKPTVVAKTDPPAPVEPPPEEPPPAAASGGPDLLVISSFAGFGLAVVGAGALGAVAGYDNAIVTDLGNSKEVRTAAQEQGKIVVVAAIGVGVVAVALAGLGVTALLLPE